MTSVNTAGKTDDKRRKNNLYEYVKVYPRAITGKYRNLKWLAMAILLGIYYLAPFLRWDRGPDAPSQAILIDMPGRRAYFFFIEIWPQEVYYLTGILIIAAIGLFFVTSLLGRVWCGFTCWQTVWSDMFIKIEEWFEGDRNARMKLDQEPWSVSKALRKTGKHIVWVLVAMATGGAFVMYFDDAPSLLSSFPAGTAGTGIYSSFAVLTALTYLMAGWAREQVCIYMCPWPRFQAAMVDDDSLIITYETWRGEPRGPVKGAAVREKGALEAFAGRGHCVDCKMCVQVCPAGIDIRNGMQLACFGCGLCIDACNSVMDKFGLPRGLITYDSLNRQVAREKGQPIKPRLVRPRTVLYAGLMLAVGILMSVALGTRHTTELNIQHDRSPLYVPLSDGSIRNGYTVKVLNMVRQDRTYELKIEGLTGAKMSAIGVEDDGVDNIVNLEVLPDRVGTFQVFVSAAPEVLKGKRTDVTFVLTEKASGDRTSNDQLFAGPGN